MNNARLTFKAMRKLKGTQAKVAKDVGISEIYVRKIEGGAFTPGRDLMFKLAQYFDIDEKVLFPDYFESMKRRLINR
ncbi:helix-turn-helix transcriptional regulator [Desulfosporosinus sp. OT]|uniref:helix-turn-helix transcriptional regulator n=1 Tax=Desulfosporosinus sp. OT TaxID=913865 RepID=UPI000223A4D8|nr:helix-turn-helix transcriptional regulator [Desulfosporosinus sp. OT]EGW37074.1 helix-turn-helix family protein [Desulfosporosinus sp. OT]